VVRCPTAAADAAVLARKFLSELLEFFFLIFFLFSFFDFFYIFYFFN